MKRMKKVLLIVGITVLVFFAACWIYVSDYYRADSSALAALESDGDVSIVQVGDAIGFLPESTECGFIFYPGGKVEFTSYVPLMRMLAEHNILCVLVEMPCNLAVLDRNAAEGIQQRYPQISRWYIGGHSLGGSMAASYAGKHAEEYKGLVLLAAYSATDLTDTNLDVISIYGSEDKVLNMEKYEEYAGNLPDNLEETILKGGCHAYFGSYGPQAGDGIASITAQVQQEATVLLLADFFS